MKIYYGSDLHLEFEKGTTHTVDIPTDGDLLLLAGDIYTPHKMSTKKHNVVTDFFKEVSDKFKNVVMIVGNHEHYFGYFDETFEKINELVNPFSNIHFLENGSAKIDDINIVGCTLWTDVKNFDPNAAYCVQSTLNDYSNIKYARNDIYSYGSNRLQVNDTCYENKISCRELQIFNDMYPNDKKIFLTHHQPICMPNCFRDLSSYAYFNTNLDDFIYDLKNTTWICGHAHIKNKFKHGTTNILCNPRGYIGYEKISETFKFVTIEE